jgi:glycosyltransferase involved in cell wall biosynthesis
MHLGLPAFARLLKAVPDVRLTLVGKGPDETRWRRLADTLGISEHIEWVQWVDRNELPALYGAHDIFLFPSLHDSGGMVVLEAMAHGLPVVCFDLGGPGVMVDDSCGRVVATKGKSETDVVNELAEALIGLVTNSSVWSQLHNRALNRTKYFSWKNLVCRMYGDLEKQNGI